MGSILYQSDICLGLGMDFFLDTPIHDENMVLFFFPSHSLTTIIYFYTSLICSDIHTDIPKYFCKKYILLYNMKN